MRLSLAAGVVMLFGKGTAWLLTGSAAIFSDAAESVVHIVAVGFATFSFRLEARPATPRFLYGMHRVSYFSAGFEGAAILLAGAGIIITAAQSWMAGVPVSRLGIGTAMTASFAIINLLLGSYLIRAGRRAQSFILEANGRHVLTDSWTSFGVVAGLLLALVTGWKPIDPLVAITVALSILWTGGHLIAQAVRGLMDYSDPAIERQLHEKLDALCAELGIRYHHVRYRSLGRQLLVEVHLLFPYHMEIGEAHTLATTLERRMAGALDWPAELVTHLESSENHLALHPEEDLVDAAEEVGGPRIAPP